MASHVSAELDLNLKLEDLLAHDTEFLGFVLRHWLEGNIREKWEPWDDDELKGLNAVLKDLLKTSEEVDPF